MICESDALCLDDVLLWSKCADEPGIIPRVEPWAIGRSDEQTGPLCCQTADKVGVGMVKLKSSVVLCEIDVSARIDC